MASNLDKVTPEKTMKALRDVTGATNEQIAQFCEGRYSPQQVLEDDELAAQLIDFAKDSKAQDAAALATTAPSKPAKRGRGKKGQQAANIEQPKYEAPKNGLQTWHQDTEQKLDVIHEEIDTHLSQVEEAEAGAIVNRFGQVIPNILGIVNDELGRSHGDIDSFRQSFRSAIGSTGAGR